MRFYQGFVSPPAGARVAACFLLSALAGCAGYTASTANVVAASNQGNIDQSLADLEQANGSADKPLLYYMEKGQLLREKGDFAGSQTAWLAADAIVRGWEDAAKNNPTQLMGELGSLTINDTTRPYTGRDYEKVFLNVNLALDHLALGDWNAARIEITKMHEREAVIADYRAREIAAATQKANEKGITARSYEDLNGYPVATLEDPAVRGLANSYQSAFANYLAGFIYEAEGETSLAAPGYRKAAEMQPHVPLLETALSGLDQRIAARGRAGGNVDTLIVVETGTAPTVQSVTLPLLLPIPRNGGIDPIATPLSWPVIDPDPNAFVPDNVTIDGTATPAAALTDVNLMARRTLADEMPGIITRSAIRAITRGAVEMALDRTAQSQNPDARLIGGLFSLAVKVTAVSTEVADERIWRTLPEVYSVARISLPPGSHSISINTPAGVQSAHVMLAGQYAVVTLQSLGGNLYTAATTAPANLIASAAVTP